MVAGLFEVLIRATRAARVLEIGTGTGRSGLEIAAALPVEGGLITVEKDASVATRAREVFAAAGFDRSITVMIGDASRYLHKVAGPFDLIVQDSDPSQYSVLHDKVVSLLRPSGTLVTRNVAAGGGYNERLAADSRLTTVVLDIEGGVAISVKRLDIT